MKDLFWKIVDEERMEAHPLFDYVSFKTSYKTLSFDKHKYNTPFQDHEGGDAYFRILGMSSE